MRYVIWFEDSSFRSESQQEVPVLGLGVDEWRKLGIPAVGMQFYDIDRTRISSVLLDFEDDDIMRIREVAESAGTCAWTRPAEGGYLDGWNTCRTLHGGTAFSGAVKR